MIELQGEAFGTMQQTFGGDTLNTAVYLARCGRRHGIQVSYATGLGDDGLSAGMMQRWADEGIGRAFGRRIAGRMPGLYLIEVDAKGERRFSYWRDQAAVRSYFDVPEGSTPLEVRAGEIDALYFSGISLAILQPDLSHAGGITECHKIAAMAEAYDVAFAPHCPLGPVALAACLQVDFTAHNAVLQEQSMGIHYNRGAELLDYVINKEDFRINNGYIAAPPKPGLGVEVDEERVVHASRNAPDWHNPVWRHADGSVAEW